MSDATASSSETPPPHTTGGGFRWEPPTAADLQAMMPGYTIEKILGRGGMGAVYKGVQENLDRTVAIKILPPGVEKEDPSFAERFKSEARLMAKLNHPGVVAVYDFGKTSGGQLYFAMEYVDGTDVAQMIKAQRKLPPDHSLAITAHMCDALGAAHELGIVHRDIKPANVLLNMKGQVKVADFGLAKVEEPGTHGLTKTGYAMGTPDFVAPEVLMLGTHIDGRADLYAVGVMLYQMLTGEVPRGAFKPASVLVPGLDRRYDPIIMKAMQSDREERYQSSAELRADLDVILTVPLVKQDAPTGAAAIPAAQVAQAPGQRSMAQKPQGKPPQPKSTTGTPARQDAAPAGKSAHGTTQSPKSKAPLFIGLGIAAAVAIGAFVMFGGKKEAKSGGTSATTPAAVASATKSTAASPTPPVSKTSATGASYAQPAHWVDVTSLFRENHSANLKTEGEWSEPTKTLYYRIPNEVPNMAVRCVFANRIEIRLRQKDDSTGPRSYSSGISGHIKKAHITRVENNERTTLAESPVEIVTDGSEHEMVVTIRGEQMELWLDGRRVVEARDAAYTKGYAQLAMIADKAARGRIKKLEYGVLEARTGIAAAAPAAPVTPKASAQSQWTTFDLSAIQTLEEGKKIRRIEDGVLHLSGGAAMGHPNLQYRNGALRFACLWNDTFKGVEASLRFHLENKISLRITPAEILLVDVEGSVRAKTIARFNLPETIKMGSEPVFTLAAVGTDVFAWLDGKFLGKATTQYLEAGYIRWQSGANSKLKNLEYLNLDGLSEPEALKVLGLDAKGAAQLAPMPVAAVSPSPSPSASASSDKFPPGQWVKPITKFEDLSQKARNEYKLTWKDGWIGGTAAPEGYMQIGIPNTQARNQGVRVRLKHDPRAAGTYPGGLILRTVSGHRYTLTYNFADHSARIALSGDNAVRALSRQTPKQVPPDGSEYELEFYAIGDRLIGRMNGELLPIGTDASIAEGYISFSVKHLIRDLEVINLDGLSEAEALKLAGVDEKGNDLRQPAAVAATSPAPAVPSSPSLPISKSSDKFPPGQWVKVFTRFEDLPEKLRMPESGVKWDDGWIIPRASKKTALGLDQMPATNNHGIRATFRVTPEITSSGEVRVRSSASSYVLSAGSDYVLKLYFNERLPDGTYNRVLLGQSARQTEWQPGRLATLEFSVLGNHLYGRLNGQLVVQGEDARLQSGRMAFMNVPIPIRDIEVINLDGLAEAEALKILGVDDKGNDLRKPAAVAQEKQAMEQAKVVDAASAIPELKALHEQFAKLTAERVTAPFEADVAKLNAGYVGGIDRKIAEETAAGQLDGIIALEAEKKLLADQQPIPADDAEGTTANLKALRTIYRAAYAKIEAARVANLKQLTDPLTLRLKQLETDLTKQSRVPDAKTVREYREKLAVASPANTATVAAAGSPPGGGAVDIGASAPAKATLGKTNQREVLEWLLSLGAAVTIQDDGSEKKITAGIKIPTGRIVITRIEYGTNMEQIWDITDEDLGRLNGLNELRVLRFGRSHKVTGSGYVLLGSLPSLETLQLNFPKADPSHLVNLPDFPTLMILGGLNYFTAEQFESLPPLKSLRGLEEGNNINDLNLAAIVKRGKLTKLQISNCKITDNGLALLEGLQNLEALLIHAGRVHSINGSGLVHLAKLPQLKRLSIGSGSFEIKNALLIQGLKHLTELSVAGDGLKDQDEWIKQLSALKGQIEIIRLRAKSGFTAEHVAALRKALPKVNVELN